MSEVLSEAAPKAMSIRQLFGLPNFRRIWLGQAVSDLGDSLTSLTMLLLVNKLTGSVAALAAIALVLGIPQIAFGMVAGVFVDRYDRKKIMLLSDSLRGLLVLGLAVVAVTGTIWPIFVLAFLQASIGTFFTPARSALMPNIIPAQGLLAANSFAQTCRVIAMTSGAALAGLVVGVTNLYWPNFVVDAATFFFSVFMVFGVVVPTTAKKLSSQSQKSSLKKIFAEIIEGLSIIKHNRLLLGSLVGAAIMMLGLGAVNVLFTPLLINDLKVEPVWFGAVDFAQTSSMILSGLMISFFVTRLKPGIISSVCMLVLGVLICLIAPTHEIWQVLLILFGVGWFITPLQAVFSTLSQTEVEDAARGRVGATTNTVVSLATLLSNVFAGTCGELVGVRNVFLISGGLAILAGVLVFWLMVPSATKTEPTATTPTLSEL